MAGRPKGTPKTGGRVKGTPNKSTAEIKELAQSYAPEALQELARLASHAKAEQARVSAIALILDRAYGKPTQPIGGDEESPLRLIARIERVVVDADSKQLSYNASRDESNDSAD
jgi:hypothetical protein